MVEKRTWEEFRNIRMLWWINMILHTMGWAIVVEMDGNVITEVYPARVKFRGFPTEVSDVGYARVTEYLKDNAEQLFEECNK